MATNYNRAWSCVVANGVGSLLEAVVWLETARSGRTHAENLAAFCSFTALAKDFWVIFRWSFSRRRLAGGVFGDDGSLMDTKTLLDMVCAERTDVSKSISSLL